MRNLTILVKMQLKEQFNFKRYDLKDIKLFDILVSTVGAILKFCMVTALCVGVFWISKYLGLFSLTKTVPNTVVSLVFTIMLAASVLSCTVGLTRSMYFSRDNAILLTLPCLPIQVYLSKLIIFFVFEVARNFSFIVPLFIAYFITHGYGAGAYFWMLLCILFLSLFTVAIGSLLSIPAMWLSNLFRQHRTLQALCLVTIVGGATAALFFGISLIPENIDLIATWGTTFWQIQAFLENYAKSYRVLYEFSLLVLGETKDLVVFFPVGATLLRFLCLLGATAVALVLGLLIVRPLFYKMASKPFEHMKRRVRPKKNRVLPRPISAIWVETLVAIKGAGRLFANVGTLIALPMLIYLLNKIFLAMNTREMGNFMVVAFNVLMILLVALNSNFYASSVYSRDGRSAYLIKTQPARYWPLLIAKLIPTTLFMLLSLGATFVIVLTTTSIGTLSTVMLMVSILAVYFAHLFFCAEMDLMNPQIELYATVGASERNVNESRATLSAFLISFGIAGVMLLLLLEGGTNVYAKFLVLSLVAVSYRVYMFFSKIKLYYKEK
ncbi:MAG: hypothetical protein IJW51_05755 [Clostridia bacterium]|nr:hypothetical protein [Clostridia bacterium]